jgi:hypothetical protein
MSAVPLWVQYAQAAALVALAIIGALIAFRQWRTAHNALRLNLFDRRFEVYVDALTFIGNVLQRGYPENEDYPILLRARDKAQFLFGPEVVECLKNVNDTAVTLRASHHKHRSAVGEARQVAAEDNHALFLKFTQFDANLTRLMRPYLRFSQIQEKQ